MKKKTLLIDLNNSASTICDIIWAKNIKSANSFYDSNSITKCRYIKNTYELQFDITIYKKMGGRI